jgi:starvation-inducible outer membrane lipoprotein
MKYLLMISLGLLTACSSNPKVAGFKGVEALSRQEIIQANKECINAKMRPNIQYVPQKTEFGALSVPVSVNCDPYNR